jgi:hypothetical protein
MVVLNFPSKLPTPQQLVLPRAQLSELLLELTKEIMQCQEELLKADNAPEFAAAVRKTAEKVGEASAGWSALCDIVRDSWRI